MRAYLDETADIPLVWLEMGLRSFRDEAGRTFLPSVAEIRTACARSVVSERRKARGDDGYRSNAGSELDVAGVLDWARKRAPNGPAQVHYLESQRKAERSVAAGNAAAAAQIPQGPRGQSVGQAVSSVLSGLTVVDADGRKLPVHRLVEQIWGGGVLVPPKGHPDRAHSMQGRQLATMLAYRQLGIDEVPSTFRQSDWERLERHIRRFAAEWPGKADISWWDEVRETWWQRAHRNEVEAQ